MKEFKEYYTQEKIIKYLCKIRIKYSKRMKKVALLNNLTSKDYFVKDNFTTYDKEIYEILKNILPPRRLWLKRNQKTYKWIIDPTSNERIHKKINTEDKYKEILFRTIKKFRKDKPHLDFVINLNNFIDEIVKSIEGKDFEFTKPDIIPEIKETNKSKRKLDLKQKKTLDCRPISRFPLKDRIILSITNKYFTDLFDDYFEDCSLAFRAVKEKEGMTIRKNHHTAIKKIIDFKNLHIDSDLYVAECDMKKFYDSVNHKICLESFVKLIEKVKDETPNLDLAIPINIFKKYLDCYSFQDNVLVLNNNEEYWAKQKDKNGNILKGNYPWIKDEIKSNDYYRKNEADRIGVPQGGALSGLISNIVLDMVDKRMVKYDKLFYIRYCDDMILMHPDKNICEKAINDYKDSIKNEMHLFTHDFRNKFKELNRNYCSKNCDDICNGNRRFRVDVKKEFSRSYKYSIKPFWGMKSKGPYRWGKFDISNNSFPWIGFVGYEIDYLCNIRVRKRSLKKEILKQNKIIKEIKDVIKINKQARNNFILRSAYEKLNGMSIGRIELYNYKTIKNEMCWAEGFQCLNLNKYSKKQLKSLDNNKYEQIKNLKRFLVEESVEPKNPKYFNNEIYYNHKPFSYYFQVGEKKHLK
jgi:hypothetical protein